MQKITTPLKGSDLFTRNKGQEDPQELQPKVATLQKILQFASSYRVEQINENQFVEIFMN